MSGGSGGWLALERGCRGALVRLERVVARDLGTKLGTRSRLKCRPATPPLLAQSDSGAVDPE